jgi:hypothetical protein
MTVSSPAVDGSVAGPPAPSMPLAASPKAGASAAHSAIASRVIALIAIDSNRGLEGTIGLDYHLLPVKAKVRRGAPGDHDPGQATLAF